MQLARAADSVAQSPASAFESRWRRAVVIGPAPSNAFRVGVRVGENSRSKSAWTKFSVSDLQLCSLAGYGRLIRSNLCTRHI
jgi:hypothetical protein